MKQQVHNNTRHYSPNAADFIRLAQAGATHQANGPVHQLSGTSAVLTSLGIRQRIWFYSSNTYCEYQYNSPVSLRGPNGEHREILQNLIHAVTNMYGSNGS